MPYRFDESNPQLFIIYTGEDHDVSDYKAFLNRWAKRFESEDRFGVIVVNEPHEHHHDSEEERLQHEEDSAYLIKLINEFRRNYRVKSNAKTIGFVNVYDPNEQWVIDYDEAGWEQLQDHAERRANYMFGTRGRYFTDVDTARNWIKEQASLPPVNIDDKEKVNPDSARRIGLFYGSTTGVTEDIAYKLQAIWQEKFSENLNPINIGRVKNLNDLLTYDHLILGVPTWNIGQLQDDWDIIFPDLTALDFTGKHIALFGIGDQYNYADNFLDALGILGKQLRDCGATLVGFTNTDGYEFSESRGIEDSKFMGLGIDEIHQAELSTERLESWVSQIVEEFSLQIVT
ncbi:MAG: hypothetical protein Phog2KO_28830 [Phototrophicaceae bacterium]